MISFYVYVKTYKGKHLMGTVLAESEADAYFRALDRKLILPTTPQHYIIFQAYDPRLIVPRLE